MSPCLQYIIVVYAPAMYGLRRCQGQPDETSKNASANEISMLKACPILFILSTGKCPGACGGAAVAEIHRTYTARDIIACCKEVKWQGKSGAGGGTRRGLKRHPKP